MSKLELPGTLNLSPAPLITHASVPASLYSQPPATLTFSTGAPEIMEGVSGRCEYLLTGANEWVASGAGEKFSVPGNSSFQIRVSGEPYSYICHFG